ncbi:MAG: hypothetical protein CVU11_04325 [Bacteroidetes bacterium HGW-Bacteroidetes-6]|jgi:2-polyprenyl-3-methyl-5-hydroxy-6-metoxy-1,4-benzoquinol methylase|nr:MAG: hypothetical protein CVU11_04325 [Bacteroidetes bacterium HGW-Bacteroidetes-6]
MTENSINQESVSEFYDNFSSQQQKTGLTLRHYFLASKLAALTKYNISSILEVGCGVGTFTSLIGKLFPAANVTGVDISEKNVDLATKRLSNKRFDFKYFDFSDVVDLNKKFDLVIFADVLEHIPVERYTQLFDNLSSHSNEGAFIFINIPHPQVIHYLKKNRPELLQIVDQPISQNELFPYFLKHNFIMLEMKEYALTHAEYDYVYYMLKKGNNSITKYTQLPKQKIILRKLRYRLK